MISTVYANAWPWSAIVLLVAALGTVAAAGLLARAGRRGRRIALVAGGAALLLALAAAFAPDAGGRPASFCAVGSGVPTLDVANLVMLMPAALLLAVGTRAPVAVLAAGCGCSAAVELAQALLPGLGRSCDLNDWDMNAAGVLAGVLLGAAAAAVGGRHSVRECADQVRGPASGATAASTPDPRSGT